MWIARDKNGTLRLHFSEPKLSADQWDADCYNIWSSDRNIIIDEELFPELKWENKPLEIKLVPKNIDAHKISRLASIGCPSCFHYYDTQWSIWKDGFIEGYIKAMED